MRENLICDLVEVTLKTQMMKGGNCGCELEMVLAYRYNPYLLLVVLMKKMLKEKDNFSKQ